MHKKIEIEGISKEINELANIFVNLEPSEQIAVMISNIEYVFENLKEEYKEKLNQEIKKTISKYYN